MIIKTNQLVSELEDNSLCFEWIEDMDGDQITNITEDGCASGAYMPAVTYHAALETMTEHGDSVFSFLEDYYGDEIPPPSILSWSSIAVHYLSVAVETWAFLFTVEEDDEEDDEDDDE